MKLFIFFLFISFIFLLQSCMTFRKSDEATIKEAKKYVSDLKVFYFKQDNFTIRYFHYENPNKDLPLLVLIHGAPGSSSALLNFLENKLITENYSVLILDRMGYGYSNYGEFASIQKQSELIISLINNLIKKNQAVFIAGHSYGGTVAACISASQPSFLKATALMAPALDPNNEKYFWFGKIAYWKATRWMVSAALRVSADEKYTHAEELKQIEPNWEKINSPILHIHGDKDNIVPFINLNYTQSKFPKAFYNQYVWKDMNHFFPFTSTQQTSEILHQFFYHFKDDKK